MQEGEGRRKVVAAPAAVVVVVVENGSDPRNRASVLEVLGCVQKGKVSRKISNDELRKEKNKRRVQEEAHGPL